MLQLLMAAAAFGLQPTSFTIELPVSPETREGQRLIALRAIEACAGRYPDLGRYTFEGTEVTGAKAAAVPPSFTVRQVLVCRDTAPAAPTGPALPAGWQPGEAETQRATAATMAYFNATDLGDHEAIERMLAPGLSELGSAAERANKLQAFRREAGVPGKHRIARITWYVDPPGVAPGAYAAVDFDRQYGNFSVSCGFLIWHRQADGSLLLTRQETGNAPKMVSDAQRLAELRAMLRCRD